MKEESKEIIIDMNELTRLVYNKIALWNNESKSNEDKSIVLKSASYEIVEMVLTEAFSGLKDGKIGIKTLSNDTKKEKKPFFKNFFSKDK